MSTTETNIQSVKMAMEELWKVLGKMVLCAKGFALVHALLIDGYTLHWEAKLLDASALAALELFPRLPLLIVPSCRCHPCGGGSGWLCGRTSCRFGGGRPQC